MRKLLIIPILFIAALAHGQTACSPSNPCVNLTITNSSMAATVTTSPGGLEISGPGTATLYKCSGSSTSCSASALASFISNPSGQSVWSIVQTFPQTSPTVGYSDAEPYSSLMNYAASNTWTGGGTGPVSQIFVFPFPQAPQASPAGGSVTGVFTTSGNVGPH